MPDWNTVYGGAVYHYGVEPNAFVRGQMERPDPRLTPPLEVLELAAGEGRNAVYLAGLGHEVTAVDSAEVGLAKCRELASSRGVRVRTVTADLFQWSPSAPYDLIVATFLHVPPAHRNDLAAVIVRASRPGSMLVAQWFHPRQRREGRTSGGPSDPSMMLTADDVRGLLPGWTLEHLVEGETVLNEGTGHVGPAVVTDLRARRE